MPLISNYNLYRCYNISLKEYFNILYFHKYRNNYNRDLVEMYVFSKDKKYIYTFADITKEGVLVFEKYDKDDKPIGYYDVWGKDDWNSDIKTYWGGYISIYMPYNMLIKQLNKELRINKLEKICSKLEIE